MPLISILLPYYKKEKYIWKTIRSVLNQSFKNFELIIIFDEYFKKRHEVFEKLKGLKKKDDRIKIILNNKNLGVSASRNKGLQKAKGNYVAFIDSDDLWNKKKLEIQILYMIKNKLKFCHTNYYVINKYEKRIGQFNAPKNLNYDHLIKSCDIGLSTVIIHKSILNFCKFPKLKTKEDYVVWLRLSKKKIPIISLNRYLTSWRSTSDSLSSSIFQRLIDAYRVYRFFEKFSLIKSYYFLFLLTTKSMIKKINIYLK